MALPVLAPAGAMDANLDLFAIYEAFAAHHLAPSRAALRAGTSADRSDGAGEPSASTIRPIRSLLSVRSRQVFRAQPRVQCALFSAAFIELLVAESCSCRRSSTLEFERSLAILRNAQAGDPVAPNPARRSRPAAEIGEVMDSQSLLSGVCRYNNFPHFAARIGRRENRFHGSENSVYRYWSEVAGIETACVVQPEEPHMIWFRSSRAAEFLSRVRDYRANALNSAAMRCGSRESLATID